MLDPKILRSSPETVAANLKRRGFELDIELFKSLDADRKQLDTTVSALRNERNTRSKQIGRAKASGEDVQPLLDEAQDLGEELRTSEAELGKVLEQLEEIRVSMPNLLHESVPDGQDESANVEIRTWGTPQLPAFKPRDHVDLGELHHLMDFDSAAKIAGARFVVLKGELARLHRALTQFMLDLHIRDHGYTEVYVPYMANRKALTGTAQLPGFEADLFAVNTDPAYYLIPTAEVPVTNLFQDSILEAEVLPQRFVCHTPCFRSEAGSYGKDTRGMIRQHQFEKVELVQIVRSGKSYDALEELTSHAEVVLQTLELPYRVVTLCAGDLGFGAAKTYDLEVWLPGQQRYREISSCSNYESFQARRIQARWRNPETGKPELVHTLNGSGLAVGRTLIAVMENYQHQDGSIRIPQPLQTYLGGKDRIVPPS